MIAILPSGETSGVFDDKGLATEVTSGSFSRSDTASPTALLWEATSPALDWTTTSPTCPPALGSFALRRLNPVADSVPERFILSLYVAPSLWLKPTASTTARTHTEITVRGWLAQARPIRLISYPLRKRSRRASAASKNGF